jgi:ATPase subunit of ABC transporter with duplicated ATPase domains
VAALVAALKAFRGGVVLVSHDARLVQGLEADLWVCGDGPQRSGAASAKGVGHGGGNGQGGLRIERRGFQVTGCTL